MKLEVFTSLLVVCFCAHIYVTSADYELKNDLRRSLLEEVLRLAHMIADNTGDGVGTVVTGDEYNDDDSAHTDDGNTDGNDNISSDDVKTHKNNHKSPDASDKANNDDGHFHDGDNTNKNVAKVDKDDDNADKSGKAGGDNMNIGDGKTHGGDHKTHRDSDKVSLHKLTGGNEAHKPSEDDTEGDDEHGGKTREAHKPSEDDTEGDDEHGGKTRDHNKPQAGSDDENAHNNHHNTDDVGQPSNDKNGTDGNKTHDQVNNGDTGSSDNGNDDDDDPSGNENLSTGCHKRYTIMTYYRGIKLQKPVRNVECVEENASCGPVAPPSQSGECRTVIVSFHTIGRSGHNEPVLFTASRKECNCAHKVAYIKPNK